jgi:hypothetical protein
MFPNVKVAPRKDIFHALKMVTEATRGPSHDLHRRFVRDLSKAVLGFAEESAVKAVKELQQENPNLTPHEAKEEVLSSKKWKKKMYNYTIPIEKAAKNIQKCYARVKQDSKKLQTIAELEGKGYVSYIRRPVKGHCRGTHHYEIDNFLKHLL